MIERCFALRDKRSKQLNSLWASVGRCGGTTAPLITTDTWPRLDNRPPDVWHAARRSSLGGFPAWERPGSGTARGDQVRREGAEL